MNILVATPGRLLQHMDQTVGFDVGNLQILGKVPFFHLGNLPEIQFNFLYSS